MMLIIFKKGSMQGFFDAISLAGRVAASSDPNMTTWYQQWSKDVVKNL